MQIVTTRQVVGVSPVIIQTVNIWNIMKSKLHAIALTILVWTGCLLAVYGQGTFPYMDFESADLAGYSPGYPLVPVEKGLPGWKAYYGNVPTSTICYDNRSLITATISINDTNFLYGFAPLDGRYSVGL